mgnify:FL=1
MFVFSRRHIQLMIDRLHDRFGFETIDPLVDRLNTANAHRLATMWEVAFLDAFGQISDFEHERALHRAASQIFLTYICRTMALMSGCMQTSPRSQIKVDTSIRRRRTSQLYRRRFASTQPACERTAEQGRSTHIRAASYASPGNRLRRRLRALS